MITRFPAYGTTEDLQGRAPGANPATQAIAVFLYIPGHGWTSKPSGNAPLTRIRPDGSWAADITTADGDAAATRVAALLVGTNYSEPCITGLPNLPTHIYSRAVAKSVHTRPAPGVRTLNFAGYDWLVKSSTSPVGPGPSVFSDSTRNVWIDANGWLHLRVTHRSNQWQCAEIISAMTFGHGSYVVEVGTDVDALDPNVTLGLFTWSNDPADAHREIDVECGRWNRSSDTGNSQFVVQPFELPDHMVRYRTPPGLASSTHALLWRPDRVDFQALRGAYTATPAATNIIHSWAFTKSDFVPRSGDENMRFNLWLFRGKPPANGAEAEVVIRQFLFVPFAPQDAAGFHD